MNMQHFHSDPLHFRDNTVDSPNTTLLIHGWGISGGVWDTLLPHWPASAGRLIVPDLLGTGWSAPGEKGFTIADQGNALIQLLKKLDLRKVNLVGNSMGGLIALWMTLEAPELVSHLVLVNPVPASGLPLPPEYVQLFRSACTRREHRLQIMTSSMAKPPAPAVLDRLMVDAATVRPEAALEGFDSFRTAAFSDRLAEIHCPVTLLSGDSDPYLPVEALTQTVLNSIPGAKGHWLRGLGHYPQVEGPKEFTEALISVLK